MPLPKINEKTLNNMDSRKMLLEAQADLEGGLFSDSMHDAMEKLANSNPQNQKIQDMWTTYTNTMTRVNELAMSAVKTDPAKYAEKWNDAMKGISTLAGYDKNGVYNEEDSLFNVVNSSLDNKTIDTKTYTTLMTLDNNVSSSISTLSSYGKQLSINDLTKNYKAETSVNKNFNPEFAAKFFERNNDNSIYKNELFEEGAAEARLKSVEATSETYTQRISEMEKSNISKEDLDTHTKNVNKQRDFAKYLKTEIEERNTLFNGAKRTAAARENADKGFANLERAVSSNDYPEQVMQFLDKNIKQMDKGRRLFHRDSKEFKAMKTEMQNLKKYLEENRGNVDMNELQDKLKTLGKTASQYTDAKSKGLNVGSNMRNMRLNLANSISAFSQSAVDGIGKEKGVMTGFQQLQQVKTEAHASRSLNPALDTSSYANFRTSGFTNAQAYRAKQREQSTTERTRTQDSLQHQKKTEKVKGGISAPQ